MKVFVGFGYNDRDHWIEEQVFPILRGMGFTVVDGKDMHGEILQPEVQSRIEQSDAAKGRARPISTHTCGCGTKWSTPTPRVNRSFRSKNKAAKSQTGCWGTGSIFCSTKTTDLLVWSNWWARSVGETCVA